MEEALKISQIVQFAERRKVETLRDTISIALVVAAGFAGAENVVFLFRYSDDIQSLLFLRTFTAVPLHLATSVVSANSFSSRDKTQRNRTTTQ